MSLHLGNISSRVRREELESVFRRFGRCNVQLKDGFGFVVYDFPSNAEKTLRVLRGKKICGETITLSWSNRQPKPLQRFSRGNRSYDMRRGRNSARGEDLVNRKFGAKGQLDYKVGLKHTENDSERLISADMVDEATSYHQDSMNEHLGENHHNIREALPDEGDSVQKIPVDNDRWAETVGVPSNEIRFEGGLEFDRYEPYHDDDDRREEDGNQQVKHSCDSPILRKLQHETETEQLVEAPLNRIDDPKSLKDEAVLNRTDDPKSHQTCYICGESGHKMRSCPRENVSRRSKFSRFDQMGDDDVNFRDKGVDDMDRLGSKFGRRPRLSRDAMLLSRGKSYGKVSRSKKHERFIGSGSFDVTKGIHRGAWRKDHLEKKRRRRENIVPERRAKKARGPVSSTVHSDYTASRSLSHSESSRLVSSRRRSRSSRSRSGSISKCSGSGSSKSRARSRSSLPTSLSLSVSSGQPLPSSPKKIQMNPNGSQVDATSPESKEVLVEQAQLVEGVTGLDNYKLEDLPAPVETNSAKRGNPLPGYDNSHCDMSKLSSEVKNSGSPLLEKGDMTAEILSPQSLGGIKEQNSDVLVVEQTSAPVEKPVAEDLPAPLEKPNPDSSKRSSSANPTSISSEELYMVLKHYGLDQPGENEKDLPVEAYFGTARLWPWEIIYYRRLRKGPISTENYARRIAQNQEFGIVDKYIRSSSGWGEVGLENS